MNKPIQYLLVGLPYSGKTTLANELVRRSGFAHINIDELKFKRGFQNTGDDDVPDVIWDQIFREADQLIVKYLKEGKNVANEYAWVTKEWRNRARKVAKDLGFQTKIIFIKLPKKIVEKRWLENSKTKTRFHWPKEELERYLKDFEEPTRDEDIMIYNQTIFIEDWINQNITHP